MPVKTENKRKFMFENSENKHKKRQIRLFLKKIRLIIGSDLNQGPSKQNLNQESCILELTSSISVIEVYHNYAKINYSEWLKEVM